jgi:hypothetical protein
VPAGLSGVSGIWKAFWKPPEPVLMRAMALIWAVILIGGITYFSIIGLTHH